MSNILGLDLSTCAGAAVVDHRKVVLHSETIQFKKLTGEPRINAIAARVMDLISHHTPALIVLEDYAVGRFAGAAIVSISIGSVVRFLLWQNEIPFIVVSPTALKKFVTGKGNAKKENMILEVYKRYGYTAPTNDEADAVGLAMLGTCIQHPAKFNKAESAVAADVLASNTKK